jgi:DNA invertase Pin-like site-specific DNA recombinase
MERPRAAIYARTATFQEQGTNFAMADQVHHCREYAARLGYTIVGEFQEVGSGINLERAVLREALEKARNHEFDVLVILDFNRLSRRQEQLVVLLTEFENIGVKVESCSEEGYTPSLSLTTKYGDALKKRQA